MGKRRIALSLLFDLELIVFKMQQNREYIRLKETWTCPASIVWPRTNGGTARIYVCWVDTARVTVDNQSIWKIITWPTDDSQENIIIY